MNATTTQAPAAITPKPETDLEIEAKNKADTEHLRLKKVFGDGRYSPLMRELYNDLVRSFKIDSSIAEKVAIQYGSDFGAYMRQSELKATFGKLSTNGKLTLGESVAKVKGCTITNSISVARAVDFVNRAAGFEISKLETQWKFSETLRLYLDTMK